MRSLVGFMVLWSVASLALADGVDEPVPSFYQETGESLTRDTAIQHPNERVDPFTGKLQWHFVDLCVPGNGGMDIKVQRSYSSMNEMLSDDSPYGAGWTLHYGRVLRKASVNMCITGQNPTSNPVLELPDGSRQVLYDSLDGTYHVGLGLWKMELPGFGGHSPRVTPEDEVHGQASECRSSWREV
ncbi:MAG TPA: DUF6531 domain-containing protein [Usitatibacter sp.]|nr:DUF6531 domain-containing protein [Usitatibacter sp.]